MDLISSSACVAPGTLHAHRRHAEVIFMKKKNLFEMDRGILRSVLGGLGVILLSACGAADTSSGIGSDQQTSTGGSSSSGTSTSTSCSSAQYSIHGTCVTANSFLEACRSIMGVPATIHGVDVCQKTTSYSFPTTYAFGSSYYYNGYYSGSLTGDLSGSNFYGITTHLNAEAGDKVSYRVSGAWGYTTVSSTSVLGGFLNFYSTDRNCRRADGNGYGYSSSSLDGRGFLVINDGTTSQAIPSSSSSYIASGSGALRVGFAIDSYYANRGVCGSFTISSLSVTHCEDAQGNTQRCQ